MVVTFDVMIMIMIMMVSLMIIDDNDHDHDDHECLLMTIMTIIPSFPLTNPSLSSIEYLYVIDPGMFNLFDDQMLAHFDPLVFDTDRTPSSDVITSPVTSSSNIASDGEDTAPTSPIDGTSSEKVAEPRFLALPKALERWWASGQIAGGPAEAQGTKREEGKGKSKGKVREK